MASEVGLSWNPSPTSPPFIGAAMRAPHQGLVGVPGLHCMPLPLPQTQTVAHTHPSATAHRRAGSGGKGVWLLLAENGKHGGKHASRHGRRHVRKQAHPAATTSAAAWMTTIGPQRPARSTRSTGRGPWTRGRRSSPRGGPPPRMPPRTPTCPQAEQSCRHETPAHTQQQTPQHTTQGQSHCFHAHTCRQKQTRVHHTRTCTCTPEPQQTPGTHNQSND